jgi:PPIC-type PPIASE domain
MKRSTLVLSLALVGCGADAPPALTVGPVSFTADQLLGLSEARRASLAELTAFALAVADSSTVELGAPLLRLRENDRLLDILAAELTLEKNGVTDAALEARYRADPEWELTVRHILFFSERWRDAEHRAEAKAKAERALDALRGGADFAETAARLSEEPGAEGRQGLLTPGREGSWVPEFWAAALALEPGEISPVTETEYGYHILRLEDRSMVPFAEARSVIARAVANRIEDPAPVLGMWLAGAAMDLSLAEDVIAVSETDDFGDGALLATWPGGKVTFGEYLDWAAAHPASWSRGGLGGDRDRFRSSVVALAQRKIALAEAARRGLELPAGEVEEIRRAWADQVRGWAATLGLSAELTVGEVAEASLVALARTGQGASLARDALGDRAPLLFARYDVAFADAGTDPTLQP